MFISKIGRTRSYMRITLEESQRGEVLLMCAP